MTTHGADDPHGGEACFGLGVVDCGDGYCSVRNDGGACGGLGGSLLHGRRRVPDPRSGEGMGARHGGSDDTSAGGNGSGSCFVSSSVNPGLGGGSPRGGRGPGSPLGSWGVPETTARMFVLSLMWGSAVVGLAGILWMCPCALLGGP